MRYASGNIDDLNRIKQQMTMEAITQGTAEHIMHHVMINFMLNGEMRFMQFDFTRESADTKNVFLFVEDYTVPQQQAFITTLRSIENSAVLFCVLSEEEDAKTTLCYDPVFITRGFAEMMETTQQQMMLLQKEPFCETVHPDDQQYVEESVRNLNIEHPHTNIFYRKRNPQGKWFYMQSDFSYLVVGKKKYVYVTYQDVSALQKNEELSSALHDRQKRDEELTNALKTLGTVFTNMLIVHLEDRKAEWLKTQEDKADILECFQDAYAVRDLIGNNYMLPEYRQGYLEFTDLDTISERLENHKILRYIYRNRSKQWIALSAIVQNRDENGRVTDVQFLTHDVTDQRERELQQEGALRIALASAEHANKAKTDFLSNMSHDIRTPMNAIIGIISLIRHNAGDKEKVIEYADKIAISSQHLLGIINDVLDMSKIEAGKTVFKYSDFSILDAIEELNTIFHSQANEKNQSFIITKENLKHEWVNGDKVHLMQIFSNLLSNAIKYTQEGGIIQFIAEESETNSSTYGKYHFIVSDNGMGMSADFKETIFDAFTRAESSVTNKIQGTGLGMAITKNLVESMGGTIEVESEPNRGSSFEVILNLKIVENRVVSSTEQIEMHETDSDILDGMRILCAEDNELNAEILMELLKLEGAECTICENGKRILEAFEQSVPGEYDMILMDVQMPVMNGYEATEAIRRSSHEQAKTIPIIAMTANAFSEDMQHSLAAGMNAHISKPVDMKLLKKTIRNIKLGREEAQFIDQ